MRSSSGVQRTVFRSSVARPLLRGLSRLVLRAGGWRVEGQLPAQAQRCVLIAAPHTSNWDFPYTLMAAFVLDLDIRWMGKASLFRAPFGGVMRWLGGIAVQRDQRNGLVASSAESLRQAQGPMQLVVPPEGTRARVTQWRSGFYYIALAAGVPILTAYMDYTDRRIGLGPVFVPSGDFEADMLAIRTFYAPFRGKHPQQFDAS